MNNKFFISNKNKISKIKKKFLGYHTEITEERIKKFLCMFDVNDMELGLYILEKVTYYKNSKTNTLIKNLSSKLKQQYDAKNDNDVYFCTMSISSGSSTDTILRRLRSVMNMSSSTFDPKFIHLNDLQSEDWKTNRNSRTIIFIDDMIGSGGTVNRLWTGILEYYNCDHKYVVGVLVGYIDMINQLEHITRFEIIVAEKLQDSLHVFDDQNPWFNDQQKKRIKYYCGLAESRKDFKYGYDNSQSLIIFYDNAPNNAIPILHHKSINWKHPLLPRLE